MAGFAPNVGHRGMPPQLCIAVLVAGLLVLQSAVPLCSATKELDPQERTALKNLDSVDLSSGLNDHAPSDDDDDDESDAVSPEEETEELNPIEAARAARTARIPRLMNPKEIGNRRPGVNFGLPFRQGDFNQEIIIGGGLGWRSKVYYPDIVAVVGDVLVFDYKWPFMHTVWKLPKKECNFIKGVEIASINQKTPFKYLLTKPGWYHFACSVPGHCVGGELFTVKVRK